MSEQSPQSPQFYTVEQAAEILQIKVEGLRTRLLRCRRKEGRDIIARIGPGVVGRKFGSSWRITIEKEV